MFIQGYKNNFKTNGFAGEKQFQIKSKFENFDLLHG